MSSFPCQSSDRHAFCHVVGVGMSDDSCAFGIQPCVAVGAVEVPVRTAARRRSATVTTWITARPMSPPSRVSAARTHLPRRFGKQSELPLRPTTEPELGRN
jgi:hypothetical protein